MSEIKYLEPKKFDVHAVDLDEANSWVLTFDVGHRFAEHLEMNLAKRLQAELQEYQEYPIHLRKEDWKDTYCLIVSLPCTMTRTHAKAIVRDLMVYCSNPK
jgi:hypothetical protein